MGIPTKPPTFRSIDWGALMRQREGDDFHKPDTAYEFRLKDIVRKFKDSGSNGGPYTPEDQ